MCYRMRKISDFSVVDVTAPNANCSILSLLNKQEIVTPPAEKKALSYH